MFLRGRTQRPQNYVARFSLVTVSCLSLLLASRALSGSVDGKWPLPTNLPCSPCLPSDAAPYRYQTTKESWAVHHPQELR